jgi:hypothetical protein
VNNQECEAQETGDQGAGSAKQTELKSYQNFKVAITLTLLTLLVVLHVTVSGLYRMSLCFLKHIYKILGRYAKNGIFNKIIFCSITFQSQGIVIKPLGA